MSCLRIFFELVEFEIVIIRIHKYSIRPDPDLILKLESGRI